MNKARLFFSGLLFLLIGMNLTFSLLLGDAISSYRSGRLSIFDIISYGLIVGGISSIFLLPTILIFSSINFEKGWRWKLWLKSFLWWFLLMLILGALTMLSYVYSSSESPAILMFFMIAILSFVSLILGNIFFSFIGTINKLNRFLIITDIVLILIYSAFIGYIIIYNNINSISY